MRIAIDDALDNGELWCLMSHGKYWSMRRNGKTKTWVRDATRFRIPFKCGLYVYGALTESDVHHIGWTPGNAYLISETDPN